MFEESTFREVIIKLKNRDKEENYMINLTVNEFWEINVSEIASQIHDLASIEEGILFYFDYAEDRYSCCQGPEQILFVPLNSAMKENVIHLRFQPKISDEFLAKNEIKPECTKNKRSRERIIKDVFSLVEQWRLLYLEGMQNQKGERQKVNLDQAASMLETPRKTLQDYFLLLRNGKALGFEFRNNGETKVGILRSFVRQHKKEEKQSKKQLKQRQMLKQLRRELFGIAVQDIENEIFNQHGSSDEDLIFYEN